jgi:DNA polymerase-3 subunit delta'
MSDTVHPRDSHRLEGIEPQAEAFEQALQRGRLHHAWLLTGPEGAGKASFAYRVARRLLGGAPDNFYGPLGTNPDDKVARMVAARSHPDLLVLEREGEDGKARRNIPVEEARRLPDFFAKSPSAAPYRVAIIDAADDLNVNAANAVLKTLEEPPPRGVLLLVGHAPGRLLPTIRSRCRTLAFAPWSETRIAEFLVQRAGLDPDDADRLAAMAQGAPGRALSLHASGALELDAAAAELIASVGAPDEARLVQIADGFRGGEGAARFALLMERLAERARGVALSGVALPQAAAWAEAWERLLRIAGETEALNLDRADAFWSALAELRRAARVAA